MTSDESNAPARAQTRRSDWRQPPPAATPASHGLCFTGGGTAFSGTDPTACTRGGGAPRSGRCRNSRRPSNRECWRWRSPGRPGAPAAGSLRAAAVAAAYRGQHGAALAAPPRLGDSGPAAASARAPQCPRRPADRAHPPGDVAAAPRSTRPVAAAPPAELICLDTFYIGQLKVVGKVWQVTACDAASHVQRVLTDRGNEFKRSSRPPVRRLGFGRPHQNTARLYERLRRAPPSRQSSTSTGASSSAATISRVVQRWGTPALIFFGAVGAAG